MEVIKYPKIPQFRNVVRNISDSSEFVGKDSNGVAIFDKNKPKPKLNFKGTVKLHGTNASVAFDGINGFRTQSRTRIITPLDDNHGFVKFAHEKHSIFMGIFKDLEDFRDINLMENTIIIYGEWAGKGINDKAGITTLEEKTFFIFGVKVKPLVNEFIEDNEQTSNWLYVNHKDLIHNDDRIYHIDQFETYNVEIDFSKPKNILEMFNKLVDEVEGECPVSKQFGIDNGVGEGIVWSCDYKGSRYMFKTKGDKHSKSKVKRVQSVDPEKLKSVDAFVETMVDEERVLKGIENGAKGSLDNKNIGLIIKWVMSDIMEEESDTLEASGLTRKDVNGSCVQEIKNIFFKIQEDSGF